MPGTATTSASHESQLSSRLDGLVYVGISLLFLADAWHLLDTVQAHSPNGVPHVRADRCILAFGVAGLLAMRFFRGKSATTSARFDAAIGAICGVLFFSRSLGISLVDPRNIEWLLRGDWAAHYAGWESFRSAPWTWPPGADPNVWYPVGTSVVFTDSLPLLAIPLKLLRTLLPQPFQYIGSAVMINFLLQGVCAALLMRKFRASPAAVLCGSLLFLFAPVLLWRIGHDTLTAQWLILAALLLYFRGECRSSTRDLLPWLVIVFVAALVHPYFPPMMLAIALAHYIRRIHVVHSVTWIQGSTALAGMIVVTLFAWWLAGGFTIALADASGGISSGIYTSNVLTFFNPAGFSRLIPAIPGVPIEQWEGAAYLGLGMFALLAVLLVEWVMRRQRSDGSTRDWPLFIVAFALGLFAVSTAIRLGPWQLTDWKPQWPLLESYRASGRFIWIPFYLLLLFAIARALRVFPRAGTVLLAGTLALQMWDFAPIHSHFAALRSGVSWPPGETTLTAPAWTALMAEHRHLTMLPPVACGKAAHSYLPFQLLAAQHGATFNSGYLARWDSSATGDYCARLHDDIVARRYSTDDVYVLGPDFIDAVTHTEKMHCRTLDTYTVCTFDDK